MKTSCKRFTSLPVQMKASFAYFICMIAQKGISVVTIPVFTRIMSEDEYGRVSVFFSWFETIYAIASLGIVGGIYTTLLVKNEKDSKIIASSTLGLIATFNAILALIYMLLSNKLNPLLGFNTFQILAIFLMTLTAASFGLWSIEKRIDYDYRKLVIVTMIIAVTKPLVTIILIVDSKDKVSARIFGSLMVELLFFGVILVSYFSRGRTFFSRIYWKQNIWLGIPLIPHALSQAVLSGADRIMIQSYVGDKEAGYYSLAYSVALLAMIVNSSFSQTLAPWTYQKLRGGKEKEIGRVALVTVIFVAVVNLLIILIAPEIIGLFAPSSFEGAKYVVPPIAMSVFFMHMYDWFARIEYYFEKTKYVLVASTFAAIINIFLNYLFIPQFGYLVAGYTTLVSYMIYTGMHYAFMRRVCREMMSGKTIYYVKQMVIVTLVFLASGIMIIFIYNSFMARYALFAGSVFICALYRKIIIKYAKGIISNMEKKQLV